MRNPHDHFILTSNARVIHKRSGASYSAPEAMKILFGKDSPMPRTTLLEALREKFRTPQEAIQALGLDASILVDVFLRHREALRRRVILQQLSCAGIEEALFPHPDQARQAQ
jgi:hypothetical protein